MLPKLRTGSLTEQATHALLEMILDRDFPNDRLPTEPELAERMGISRTTIRAALLSLERLGVISRNPGKGTVLRPQVDRSCMMLHRLIGFRGMLESAYGEVGVTQSFSIVDQGSPEAIRHIGADAEGAVLLNDKTYLVGDEPAVHLLQEVPVAYLQEGIAEKLVDGSMRAPATIFDLSRLCPGREIDNTVLDLVPRVTRSTHERNLGLPKGVPYLELCEVHYSDQNLAVAYSNEAVRDEFVRLRLVRTR